MSAKPHRYRPCDPVEVVALLRPIDQYDPLHLNQRPPAVGDRASIIEISGTPEEPRYFVSCDADDSSQCWATNLLATEIRPRVTPYGQIATRFAVVLATGDFDAARDLLAPALRGQFSSSQLQSEYLAMFAYSGGEADDVQLIDMQDQWPGKQAADLGYAYVAIHGHDPDGKTWEEAVTLIVADFNGHLLIREIDWGRP